LESVGGEANAIAIDAKMDQVEAAASKPANGVLMF
jgi:hypothetical protein